MEEEKNQDIFWPGVFGVAAFVDGLAFIVDVVTLIPFVGWVLGPMIGGGIAFVTGLGFWLYFKSKGYGGFWKGLLGVTGFELIPLINSLPGWIGFAVGAYMKVKSQEVPGIATQAAKGVVKRAIKVAIKRGAKLALEAVAPAAAPAIEAVSKVASAASAAKKVATSKPQF